MLAIERIWRGVVQRRVRSSLIVERQVSFQPVLCFADAVVGMQIHLFVFDTPPEPFDEYVITPAALAIHADGDVVLRQEARELLARELAALVGVEDVRRTVAVNRFAHGVHAEVGRERVGQTPRQHPATGPVQDREQVHKAALHRNIREISRPDTV